VKAATRTRWKLVADRRLPFMAAVGLLSFLPPCLAPVLYGDQPIFIRAENLTVPPSTGPVIHLEVQNPKQTPCDGKVRVKFPDGWRVQSASQAIHLAARETKRIPFAIEKATDLKKNGYPFEITATVDGKEFSFKQSVVCASAPHGKPKVDGDIRDWADSIPIAFVQQGRKTVVRTLWNRKYFSVFVEVEEDQLVPRSKVQQEDPFDAVQFALSPRIARTGTAGKKAERYEFLVVPLKGFGYRGKCFKLIEPGLALSRAEQHQKLDAPEVEDATVAVKGKKGLTYYEVSVPLSGMTKIRATEGREFFFSLLVHDPDGTGVRDLGSVMRLPPVRRTPLSWCRWKGAKWGKTIPFDSRIEWGFCSSIH